MMGLCALAALALAGCKKDEQKTTGSLTAKLTQPVSDSKTHIGAGWLRWNVNDAIKVFDAAGTAYSFTTTDNDSIVASFDGATGIYATQAYTAFYPEANTSDLTDGYVYLTLPGSQTFDEATFASNTYPMLATNGGSGTTFTFHSPCGVLAIPMTGTTTIGSIVLMDKDNAPLGGQMKISLAGLDPMNPTYDFVNTTDSITLSCGGLTLDPTTPQTFVFVVPASVFANGFTAVINDTSGNEIYVLATSNDNTIVKETITTMPVVNISGISVTTGTAEPDPTDATKYILHGSFSAPLGTSVDEVGFYYGEGTSLTKQAVTPTGNDFSLTITVAPGQTITYKAYAKNGMNEIVDETGASSFTVFEAPTVTTGTAAATSATAATGHVELTSAGTTALSDIELGICWGTTANPTISTTSNNHASVSGTLAVGNEYAVDMTGLTATTPYYVRGYAKIGGVYYYDETAGGTVSFTTLPTGAINGLFSVSETKQVYFSQGNLRAYNATANSTSGWVWSFAENQWDYIGSSGSNQYINGSMTISQAGYVDLFCWVGTSASYDNYGIMYDNDGGVWGHEATNFGNSTNDALKHDWGHNPITNGGNVADMWRTPTHDEWVYLINSRTTAAGKAPTINGTADARYAKAKLFGTNRGLIIFPDTYVHPDGVAYPTGINATGNTSWNGNQYSAADWAKMEAAGCVFLPCTGIRVYYTQINDKETRGFYASSTPTPGIWNDAKVMHFTETSCNPSSDRFRRDAGPVRLVQDKN